MMKRTRTLSAVAVAALTLMAVTGVTQTAFARGGGDCGGPGRGPEGLEHALDRLDLDDATREAIDQRLDEARQTRRELRRAMGTAHDTLHELMEADAPDQEAVMAQADILAALHTQAQKARIQVMLDVKSLLSAEQQEELREALPDRPRMAHRRRGDAESEL
ncbi:MAG: Spy/CpxP family protein refolding chaperone [Myxococcota bacterium]